MFSIIVDKVSLTVTGTETLTSGSMNIYECQFTFDDDWTDVDKTAVFQAGSTKVSIPLSYEDTCIIPYEVVEKPGKRLFVGVYGTRNGELIMPTIMGDMGSIRKGADPGVSGFSPPPTEVYAEILGIANDAMQVAQEVKADADSGKLDGRDGISPTISVSEIAGGHTLSVEDASGRRSFDVLDGKDGQDGKPGENGKDGVNGISPTLKSQEIDGGHRLTITDVNGMTTVDVKDGKDGKDGPQGLPGDPGKGIPEGGTPGQLLGKTSDGEAWVDPPESCVQSDWDQNDESAPDYIKNRPFYEVSTVLMDTTLVFDSGSNGAIVDFLMTEGNTYILTIDGAVYTGVAKGITTGMNAPAGAVYMGDGSVFGLEQTDDNYTLAFMEEDGEKFVQMLYIDPATGTQAERDLGVKIEGVEIVKIPERFLPEIGGGGGGIAIRSFQIVLDSQTGMPRIKDKSKAEVDAAIAESKAGTAIVVIDGYVCDGFNQGAVDGLPCILVNMSADPFMGLSLIPSTVMGLTEEYYFAITNTSDTLWSTTKGFDFKDPTTGQGYVKLFRTATGILAVGQTVDGNYVGVNPYSNRLVFSQQNLELAPSADGNLELYQSNYKFKTVYALPDFTAADNGKVLGVVNGNLAWVSSNGGGSYIGISLWDGTLEMGTESDGTKQSAALDNAPTIVIGKTYLVTIDGVNYKRTAVNVGIDIYIGNLSLMPSTGAADTGEPFVLWGRENTSGGFTLILRYNDISASTRQLRIVEIEEV